MAGCVHSRGMHGRGGAWQGYAWQVGMHGRGHAWQEGHAWQKRWPLQQMVCILLECILVFESITLVIYLCFKIFFPIVHHCLQ